ncbi:MAG TPA: hypothetical protein VFW07_11710 [Parafilimonas sp.]|nr:hypothetical protein [Parafilimonas sp.]
MRTEFIKLFAELNASELENLTRIVKETTTAPTHADSAKPIFTAANLWNIHNMRNSRSIRKAFIP